MEDDLKTTAELVREVATTCPDAERVLQKLFPTAFAVQRPTVTHEKGEFRWGDGIPQHVAAIRTLGKYAGKGLYLNGGKEDWEIVKDDLGCTVLLPKV